MMFPDWITSNVHKILGAAGIALIALSASSCGSGGGTSARLYTLRLPDPPAHAPASSNLTIGVELFSAVTPLNDQRILKYESPTQVRYYDEDRWVSEPTTMIPEMAARYLERMGIARQASLLPWVESMDYVLQGQILNFEEVEKADQREAHVTIELTLLRFPKRETVWTGTFRARQLVDGNDVPAAVEALSVATQTVLKDGFSQLAETLQRQP